MTKTLKNGKPLVLKAPAKINLHLSIGSRRPDGYHALETLFQEISLHDTLRFEPVRRPTLSLEIRQPSRLTATPDNLILRALHLLQAAWNVRTGLRVTLEKRIPIGAGLGGGSSNAAAALLAGYAFWKRSPRSARERSEQIRTLDSFARKLGADVPFFLRGGSAWAEGIGEKITPMAVPSPRPLVLIYPNVHVSTPSAYQLLDRLRAKTPGFDYRFGQIAPFNSFEAAIVPRVSAISQAKAYLTKAGCHRVMMSGSGSSVFGFAADRPSAERIARQADSRWQAWALTTA